MTNVADPEGGSAQAKQGGMPAGDLFADDLRKALAVYSDSGGEGQPAVDQDEAVAIMLEKLDVSRGIFHGFDYSDFIDGTATERLAVLPAAQEHVLAQEEGRERFVQAVVELSKAFALSVPRPEALDARDEVADPGMDMAGRTKYSFTDPT